MTIAIVRCEVDNVDSVGVYTVVSQYIALRAFGNCYDRGGMPGDNTRKKRGCQILQTLCRGIKSVGGGPYGIVDRDTIWYAHRERSIIRSKEVSVMEMEFP